jgi:hypothetical protein
MTGDMLSKGIKVAGLALVIAVTAASTVQASWTMEGTAYKAGEEPLITFVGPMSFNSEELGKIQCQFEGVMQATGGTTNGHILALTAIKPNQCHAQGALATICGTNPVSAVKLVKQTAVKIVTEPAKQPALKFEGFEVKFQLGVCIEVVYAGAPIATPDNWLTIESFLLEGAMTTEFGNGTVAALLVPTNKGTFGIDAP